MADNVFKGVISIDPGNSQQAFQIVSIGVTTTERNLSSLQKQLIAFGGGVKSFQNNFKPIPVTLAQTDNAAKKIPPTLNQTGLAFQRLSTSTNATNNVLLNTGRIFQDLPFGIIGIANNINPLIESFQRASAAAKETGTSLRKNLISSLTGAGGLGFAFSLISGAASLAVLGLSSFTRGFGGAGKAAADAAREIRTVGQIMEDAFSSTAGDIARVNALAQAASNSSSSFTVQKNAIEELKKVSKDYFGDLEAGKSTYDQITKSVENYTKALVQEAIVKGLQEEISELAKQLRSAGKEYALLFKATTEASNNLKKVNQEQATNVQGLTAQNREVNLATNAYNKLSVQLAKSGGNVAKLQAEFKNLIGEIGKAVSKGLELPRFDDTKDNGLDKFIDDTIAQARRLERQFGEIKIFPELEFITEKEKQVAFQNALKVLKDFPELRIPFRTRLVFDEITVEPVPPEFTKEVTEAFEKAQARLKGLKPPPLLPNEAFEEEKKRLQALAEFSENIYRGIVSTATDAFASLASGLGEALAGGNIGDAFRSFGEAIGSGLQSIGRQLIQVAVLAKLTKKALATLFSNPALALAVGVGLVAAGGALRAALSRGLQAREKGGPVDAGKPYLVGEKGPEIIYPKRSGVVIPNHKTVQILSKIKESKFFSSVKEQSKFSVTNIAKALGLKGFQSGGFASAGQGILVGERGREFFIPNTGNSIVQNNSSTNFSGQGGINVHVTGDLRAQGSELVALITRVVQSQRRTT